MVTNKEALEDLEKYADKINAMMVASVEGPCPQILKAILFQKMGNFFAEQYEKINPEGFKKATELMNKMQGDLFEMKSISGKEAEKRGLI